jgi:hypothetical protein
MAHLLVVPADASSLLDGKTALASDAGMSAAT